MKPKNIFEAIPADLPEELFDDIVASDNIRIERIVSREHSSPSTGWYDQDKNEWVMILKGEARLAFEGEPSVHLVEGDHINIPAHKKHKVEWTTPDKDTIWLAVHY